jgi:hypothetical protein
VAAHQTIPRRAGVSLAIVAMGLASWIALACERSQFATWVILSIGAVATALLLYFTEAVKGDTPQPTPSPSDTSHAAAGKSQEEKADREATQAEQPPTEDLAADSRQRTESVTVPDVSLVKLNYKQSTDRYENIYKAIWQHFSYMAHQAGAILTFGRDHPRQQLIQLIALSPLVFWFLATFLPMNHYGEKTRATLLSLERGINNEFLGPWRDLYFNNFTKFSKQRFRWRVLHAVSWFGLITIALWLWIFAGVLRNPEKPSVSAAGDSVRTQLTSTIVLQAGIIKSLNDTLKGQRLRPSSSPAAPPGLPRAPAARPPK